MMKSGPAPVRRPGADRPTRRRGRATGLDGRPCAILRLVVRHATPAVRPDDVLTALRRGGEPDAAGPTPGDPAGARPPRAGERDGGRSLGRRPHREAMVPSPRMPRPSGRPQTDAGTHSGRGDHAPRGRRLRPGGSPTGCDGSYPDARRRAHDTNRQTTTTRQAAPRTRRRAAARPAGPPSAAAADAPRTVGRGTGEEDRQEGGEEDHEEGHRRTSEADVAEPRPTPAKKTAKKATKKTTKKAAAEAAAAEAAGAPSLLFKAPDPAEAVPADAVPTEGKPAKKTAKKSTKKADEQGR